MSQLSQTFCWTCLHQYQLQDDSVECLFPQVSFETLIPLHEVLQEMTLVQQFASTLCLIDFSIQNLLKALLSLGFNHTLSNMIFKRC